MPEFTVTIDRTLVTTYTGTVEAKDEEDAQAKVEALLEKAGYDCNKLGWDSEETSNDYSIEEVSEQ